MDQDLRNLYPWCEEHGMYLSLENLENIILSQKPHLVIDSRDDDYIGGNIYGSQHVPDKDWDNQLPSLLQKIEDLVQKNQVNISEFTVIFHCMESVRRGPRCAYKLLKYYERKGISFPIIKVLEGGAHNWIHKNHLDKRLVENFDNDYWGILPFEDEKIDKVEEKIFHVGYVRPVDQIASRWSAAGIELKEN